MNAGPFILTVLEPLSRMRFGLRFAGCGLAISRGVSRGLPARCSRKGSRPGLSLVSPAGRGVRFPRVAVSLGAFVHRSLIGPVCSYLHPLWVNFSPAVCLDGRGGWLLVVRRGSAVCPGIPKPCPAGAN